MRKVLFVALVIGSAGALAGCVGDGPSSPGEEETDAVFRARGQPVPLAGPDPIMFTKVHTPEESVEILESFAQRPDVSMEEIGRSLLDRPIHHVTVGSGPFDLWIVGRHHGNEPTGGEAILLAIDALTRAEPTIPETAPESFRQFALQRDILLERLTFHFVPVANPDGSAAFSRGNAAQADLNREYFLFSQPEPVAIREAFWSVRPDGCIDLHNEGVGGTDWDAFGPDGPLIEPEIFALVHRDVDFGLYEVDAAGGRGGDYNEFYNLVNDAPVVGPIVNPTAYHPGTHDMFCSTRGAPGYTPEGAISGVEGNGAGGPVLEWSTRLHQVTIATSAFHWAGFYDGAAPIVFKEEGMTGTTPAEHEVEVPETASVRLQLVWRTQDVVNDWEFAPLEMTVTRDEGLPETYATEVRGIAWTNTAELGLVEPGSFSVTVQGPPGVPYELRAVMLPEPAPLVEVSREGEAIRVAAAEAAPGAVEFRLSDVYDAPGPDLANFTRPYPEHLEVYEGTVDVRTIAVWSVILEPGEEVVIARPPGQTGVGPYRWSATSGQNVVMGVEPARNA